jgi:hypothetical protein
MGESVPPKLIRAEVTGPDGRVTRVLPFSMPVFFEVTHPGFAKEIGGTFVGADPSAGTVDLVPEARIAARVIAADGSPVPGAVLSEELPFVEVARADARGVITIVGLHRGAHMFRVKAEGFRRREIWLQAPSDGAVIELER